MDLGEYKHCIKRRIWEINNASELCTLFNGRFSLLRINPLCGYVTHFRNKKTGISVTIKSVG